MSFTQFTYPCAYRIYTVERENVFVYLFSAKFSGLMEFEMVVKLQHVFNTLNPYI